MYEGLLHDLQLNYEVSMHPENVNKLLSNISNWSYAHRVHGGELTDKFRRKMIDRHFLKLRDL